MSDHLMPTYRQYDVTLCSGHGVYAVDQNGKEYLDLGSGIGVNVLGYAEPGWVAAVQEQAAALAHISNLYHSPLHETLAQLLCDATGMESVFFCNSGAEANECAVKLARRYSFEKYGAGRGTILTLQNAFHGRMITDPNAAGYLAVPVGDTDAMARAGDSVCAVMLECIQGEGGVVPLDKAYLKKVRALCDERDWLLIVDEVQTGAGRTGKFLALSHAGISADVVTLAKGIGGGLPIGACLAAKPFARVLTAGTHGSTFGGNPVCVAGAIYTMRRLTAPGFSERVTALGKLAADRLSAMPHVQSVRGIGLMIGAITDVPARAVTEACLRNGLLVLTAGEPLRLLPPLIITEEELTRGLDILEHTLAQF